MGWVDDILRDRGTIEINVSIYSAKQEQLLKQTLPTDYFQRIKALVGKPVRIPAIQFLTYCLFTHKSSRVPDWSDYRRIRRKIGAYMGPYNDLLVRTGTSLISRVHGGHEMRRMAEDLGVGIGLSVMDGALGIKEANWDPIPEAGNPTLDFRLGTDGRRFIQLETKGSSVKDASCKSGPVYAHAHSIKTKKKFQRKRARVPPALYFGTIGVIDTRPAGTMQCWLLDPPGREYNHSPVRQQIISRLSFIARLLQEVMPHSQILTALKERLELLLAGRDAAELDGKPLTNWTPQRWQDFAFRHISTAAHDIAGRIFELPDGRQFFYGFNFKLLEVAHAQSFQQILNLELPVMSERFELSGEPRSIEVLTAERTEADDLDYSSAGKSSLRDHAPLGFAYLHTTSSGRAFGFVSEPVTRSTTRRVADE